MKEKVKERETVCICAYMCDSVDVCANVSPS